jgi:tetratricopeptide (TPR) repeat protein
MRQALGSLFIATGFAPKRLVRAQQLSALLTEAGFNCVMGQGFGGTSISKGVQMRIAASSCVIALIEGSSNGKTPSQWIVQEVACAVALKKICLVLVEKGVSLTKGLLGDVELISFEASAFAAVFPQVLRQLNVMLQKQGLTIGIKEVSSPRLYISENPNEKDCNEMARTQMKVASSLTEGKQYDLALQSAKKATRLDNNCWQAWIKYGGLLLRGGRLDEGTKIHNQVLKDFKGNNTACAAAKHNLAVTKELRFGLGSVRANRESRPLYECSLKLDSSRVYTRAALICLYLRQDKFDKANALLEKSLRHEGFVSVMRSELDESSDGLRLLKLLPTWTQNLLYPLSPRVSFSMA